MIRQLLRHARQGDDRPGLSTGATGRPKRDPGPSTSLRSVGPLGRAESQTSGDADAIRRQHHPPLPRRRPGRGSRRAPPARRGDPMTRPGDRHRPVPGRAAGEDPGTGALLGDGYLLQRGRQGRPLRRVGTAGTVRRRDAGGVPVTALAEQRPAHGHRPDHQPQRGIVMTAHWPAPAGLHTASVRLPVESELPSFEGATGWLNSPPLTPAGLRGKGRPGRPLDLYLHHSSSQ